MGNRKRVPDDVQQKLEHLEKTNKNLMLDLTTIRERENGLKDEMQKMRLKMNVSDQTVKEQKAQIEKLKSQIKELKNSKSSGNKSLEERLILLEQQKLELDKEIPKLKGELKDRDDRIAKLEKLLKEAEL